MEVKELIIKEIEKKGSIKVSDIVKISGLTRAGINRHLRVLMEGGKVVLVGKANKARYFFPGNTGLNNSELLRVHKIVLTKDLEEDNVLQEIQQSKEIFAGLTPEAQSIFKYAFTEMLNNAIDHSNSEKADIVVERQNENIYFCITDKGVGIFNNIIKKNRLGNAMEAIQDIIKGKQTTMPKRHSGEGVFFTSKIADKFILKSFKKKVVFDNVIKDIFILESKEFKGTQVSFWISLKSKKTLKALFDSFSDNDYGFSKTEISVKLYKEGQDYVSRSQAKRILSGLEEFKTIELDFDKVKTVGQSFADEIFRVWLSEHKDKKITYKNANENIVFMIKRAGGE